MIHQITLSAGIELALTVLLAFTLFYAWLLVHRFRLQQLEERLETEGLANAIAERHAEGIRPELKEGALQA